MNILNITYPLAAVLIFVLVFGLAIFIVRKYQLRWRLFFIGAAGFIISQVLHIPFNALVLNLLIENQVLPALPEIAGIAVAALLLGLSAGFFEEFTRYGVFRWWAKDARSWARGVLLGTGWGGVEAILVGAIILITFVQMVALKSADLSSVVPAEQVELTQRQVEAYWSAPWYLTLVGFAERAFAIPIQISLSVMVLQVFLRGQSRWLWIAIAWHALIDALAVFLLQYWSEYDWGLYALEGVVALLAIISIVIIFALKTPEPEPEPEPDVLNDVVEDSPEDEGVDD